MTSPNDPQTRPHDVLVIGAGGAGLRAAIAAAEAGADVGLVCKSLLGKAHTVMAEGGVAAALRHVAPDDDWKVHFRDTMIGGYTLGCHSFRHLVGGGIDTLSRVPTRKKTYDCVSCLNRQHPKWAWFSLVFVGFTDIYIRLCSMGIIRDLRIL